MLAGRGLGAFPADARNLHASQAFDANYPPIPDLPKECVDTANAIVSLGLGDHVRRALHYFRLGLLTKHPENQFSHFWSAIEAIAERRKETSLVHIECPKCRGPLRCDACDSEPKRRPMALQAFRHMISSFVR